MSTNTSTPQQEANYLEDDDAFNTEEATSPTNWSLMSKTPAYFIIALLIAKPHPRMS